MCRAERLPPPRHQFNSCWQAGTRSVRQHLLVRRPFATAALAGAPLAGRCTGGLHHHLRTRSGGVPPPDGRRSPRGGRPDQSRRLDPHQFGPARCGGRRGLPVGGSAPEPHLRPRILPKKFVGGLRMRGHRQRIWLAGLHPGLSGLIGPTTRLANGGHTKAVSASKTRHQSGHRTGKKTQFKPATACATLPNPREEILCRSPCA